MQNETANVTLKVGVDIDAGTYTVLPLEEAAWNTLLQSSDLHGYENRERVNLDGDETVTLSEGQYIILERSRIDGQH